MKKILKLTGVGEVLTKEAQEKLDNQEKETSLIFEDITCDSGRTRDEYEALGMRVPDDLIQKEKEFENGVELDDDDFEIIEYPCRIYEEHIIGYVQAEDKTSVFTNGGYVFSVKETVEEIDELINQ